jgi:menaquinone-9 beta-reductase
MNHEKKYDIAIVGGGLGGLSLAILQAKAGKSVVLFEKYDYPQHKVCGEYISLESWDFLEKLGIPLSELNLPIIKKLQVSSPKGTVLETALDLGGFGISRFMLDKLLADKAEQHGVKLLLNTTVKNFEKHDDFTEVISNGAIYKAQKVVGAFGKRSNLDILWDRAFIKKNRTTLNQYIGVKYHIKYDFPKDLIALHNFEDGYCGISAVENDSYCLCYLTTKNNLKKSDNDISTMERYILSKNPYLKAIFADAVFLWEKPEVISQVSFEKKSNNENGISLIGDAAGMIAPLCGNGMSMAMHSAFLLHQELISEKNKNYFTDWNTNFNFRLKTGRFIQSMFGGKWSTEFIIRLLKINKYLLKFVISKTHGNKFG